MHRPALFVACHLLLASTAAAQWQAVWQHSLPARKTAWEHTQRMGQDAGYPVAVGGGNVYVGSEHDGALLALDGRTGEEKWRHFTEAPIRVAPAADAAHVWVGSDDGTVRCLTHDGKHVWSFRGGPRDRLVLGHDRLMSAWPISVAPLLADGVLYAVAGYWPVDGIYVHALDAKTGQPIWSTSAAEFRPSRQAFLIDGKLLVDGDNSRGLFDAKTGAVLTDKVDKPASPVRPEVAGLGGNATGWAEADGLMAIGSTTGVFAARMDATGPAKVVAAKRDGTPADTGLAKEILTKSGVMAGWCLVAGLGDGALVEGLLRESKLSVVAVDADAQKVETLRRKFAARGLFDGHRLTVLADVPEKAGLPPYFASLIVSETDPALAASVRTSQHPYGGVLVTSAKPGAVAVQVRRGGPEGAADWTHEFRDAANTLASPDTLVKAPLGLLWYGGEAAHGRFYYDGYVDHQSGNGLNPQPIPAMIVAGRMILQSAGRLAAFDIYTGRLLWETALPSVYSFGGAGGGLGIHSKKHPQPWKYEEALKFDVFPTHRCRASGFDQVALADGVYVAIDRHLHRFDPATGRETAKWPVPVEGDLCWGNVRTVDDVLIATLFRPQDLEDAQAGHDGNGGDWGGDRMPMKWLVALDRSSGRLLWKRAAEWGWVNRSGICAGGGKVFCVDVLAKGVQEKFAEAGRTFPKTQPILYALELRTGAEVWKFPLDVYVQNIAYSAERDLLLVPNRNLMEWVDGKWVDRSIDARRGTKNKNAAGKMRALRAKDGSPAWEVAEDAYHTPYVVRGDLLIDRQGTTYDLTTGHRDLRSSPLTGLEEPWGFQKAGCNHLVACENLVTWRCAFYDLAAGSGTKTLTGMDAGCSPTLIPAGGILNVANFGTHHKRNRMTAMALVHRPEIPLWTVYDTKKEKPAAGTEPVWTRRAGYNLGAPGDRFADDGGLWLQVSDRNRANLTLEPKQVRWFDRTASVADWVAASGAVGLTKVSVPLVVGGKPSGSVERRYRVRLVFSEPERAAPGARVFGVSLEGKPVLTDLDVAKEATASGAGIVKEFRNVVVADGTLDVGLVPKTGETVLSGIEVIREE